MNIGKDKRLNILREKIKNGLKLYKVHISLDCTEYVVADDPTDAICAVQDELEEIIDNARYAAKFDFATDEVDKPEKIPKDWENAICWQPFNDHFDYYVEEIMEIISEKHEQQLVLEETNKKQIKLEL